MARDYYGTLGVSPQASSDEIKRAYRNLAKQLHPDINPDPAAQHRFKEITSAYEVLTDPEKRQIVDLGGDPLAPGGGGGPGGPMAGGFGFGDIFDAFFGGGGQRGPRTRTRHGADALIHLDLDLAEMAFGTVSDVTVDTAVLCQTCTGAGTAPGTHPDTCPTCRGAGEVQSVQRSFLGQVMTARACPRCGGYGSVISHPCRDCAGEGRIRARRTIKVKIPPGVEHGMRIRLTGEGEVGQGGGPPGDLYVEVSQLEHELFTREGDDLVCPVTIPMTAAAMGTSIALQTLEGEEKLEIPAGTQPGTILTMRGRGVPHLRSSQRGDLHVRVDVRVPTRLDAEQERLLSEFARLRGDDQFDPRPRHSHGLFGRRRGHEGRTKPG